MASVPQSALVGAAARGLLAAFATCDRLWIALPVCLAPLAVDPAWTLDPYHGDCGATQETANVLATLLGLAIFVWDLARLRRRRPR